jgi:hypothetical protein
MKNAHERFGVLEYTKRMKDTTTRIRLRLDRFIGEVEDGRNGKAHLISVLGGDSDVGAIWAAVIEQNHFTVEAPGIESVTASLGEGRAMLPWDHYYRRSQTNPPPGGDLGGAGQDTRPGADPQGRRTILCDNDPTFVLYRIAQRFGLPVVPEWADWFNEELNRRGAIKPTYRSGMLSGAGQRHEEVVPEMDSNVPCARSGLRFLTAMGRSVGAWPTVSFQSAENDLEEGCCQALSEECPTFQVEGEDTQLSSPAG